MHKIIVDLSHNEAIEEFPESSLDEDTLEVEYIDKNEGPIDFEKLEEFDILFIGNIQQSEKDKTDKFTPTELQNIKKFIGEGGGLLLTSGDGGDRDVPIKLGSIRVLYKITGVRRFWNGIIQETTSNFLVKKQNILINEMFAHPITKGITELVLPNATFFTTTEDDVEDLIVTSEKSAFRYYADKDIGEIGPVPICTANKFHSGRCITVGSTDWLQEDNDFGLDAGDNLKFLSNILEWLAFES
jgi:hypothetical protein